MALNEVINLPSLLVKLEEHGYETIEELKSQHLFDLRDELQLTKEEVKILIKVCDKEPKDAIKRSLGELITAERENSISTSSKGFNKLLEYGVPPFKISEICGESGAGKSQLCMQLAVNVQLPKSQGGVEGECIYIDTEGSFQSSRIVQMARKYNVGSILKGIHLFRVLDHTELLALIKQLPTILKEYTKIKLIIIDSIAYHFRLNVLDSGARIAILDYIAQLLLELAKRNDLAVVATNHVTTDGIDGTWTPSLGASWGYWCANRLFLFRKREFRLGYLYKSVENAGSRPVQFCIKNEGIADPEEAEMSLPKKDAETEAEINNRIDTTWEEVKSKHVKEQAQEEEIEKLDDMWDNEALVDEFMSQLPLKSEQAAVDLRTLPDPLADEELSSTQAFAETDLNLFEGGADTSSLSSIENTSSCCAESNLSSKGNHIPDKTMASLQKKRNREEEENQTNHETSSKSRRLNDGNTKKLIVENVNTTSNIPDDHVENNSRQQECIASKESNDQDENHYWASDSEQDMDMDFLANIQSYF